MSKISFGSGFNPFHISESESTPELFFEKFKNDRTSIIQSATQIASVDISV